MSEDLLGRPFGQPCHSAEPEPVSAVSALTGECQAQGFFPFTVYAYENEHFTSSPSAFRETFIASKPDELSWYAYDVVIHSPTWIEFIVYGMRDSFYGGIGKQVARIGVCVEPDLTRSAIDKEALSRAEAKRSHELICAEHEIIRSYADQILAEVSASAIEAGMAETAKTGSVHESAVPKEDAQPIDIPSEPQP